MFQYSIDKTCELLQEQLMEAGNHGEVEIKVCY